MQNYKFLPLLALLSYASLLTNYVTSLPVPDNDVKIGVNNTIEVNNSIPAVPSDTLVNEANKSQIIQNETEKLSLEYERSLIDQISTLTYQHYDETGNSSNATNASIEKVHHSKAKIDTSPNAREGRALGRSSSAMTSTTMNPLIASFNNFFETFKSSFTEFLINRQTNSLRLIGRIDNGLASQQGAIQKSAFNLVLQGQKTAAKAYDSTPKFVNTLIQRIGTTRDTGFYQRLNQLVNLRRENREKFFNAWEEHEHDYHNVFNNKVWPTVNQYLRVPELPSMPKLGWN